jgi:hypothetical protein
LLDLLCRWAFPAWCPVYQATTRLREGASNILTHVFRKHRRQPIMYCHLRWHRQRKRLRSVPRRARTSMNPRRGLSALLSTTPSRKINLRVPGPRTCRIAVARTTRSAATGFAIEVGAPRYGPGTRTTGSNVKRMPGATTFCVLMGAADPACPMRNASGLICKMRNAPLILRFRALTNAAVFLAPGGFGSSRTPLFKSPSNNPEEQLAWHYTTDSAHLSWVMISSPFSR